jgi:hypothetical protein
MKMIIKKHMVGTLAVLALAAFSVTSQAQGTYIVDDFAPSGVSPSNPTNYDYYQSSNNYASGQITNVWWNWFGGAFQSVVWDSTMDAKTNPASGSMKITANFSSANNQFCVWDQGTTNNYFALNLNCSQYTNFEADVRFAPGSASDSGTYGSPIFGYLRFGDRTAGYGQDWFGGTNIAANNTNWVHVSIPISANSDANLQNFQGVIIGIDRNYYSLNLNGLSTVWVDNIKLVGPATPVTNPPPTMAIGRAVAGLRIFAGTSGVNDRAELATADQNQSWIGGTYPVSYSFTLLSYPTDIGQTHIFLVPVNSMPGTPYSYNGIDYTATNGLWLVISPYTAGQVTATIYWKTNLPNANPYATGGNTALRITNSTAIGTWTLTFTNANAGTLTAPDAGPAGFTITNGTVATDFANPLVAYFGLQPNSTAGVGEYEDWASISVTGVYGVKESEDFTKESTRDITASGYWNNSVAALPTELVLISTNDMPAYWVNWTVPAINFAVSSTTNLLSGKWISPTYYDGYFDETAPYGAPLQFGINFWEVLPKDDLPTVDGSQNGVPAPTAFFLVSTNVVYP